jgi:glycosyltransferase involved in cell wall biosynthesis
MRITVLHIVPGLNGGGIERFLYRFISKSIRSDRYKGIDHKFAIHERETGIVELDFKAMGFSVYRLPVKTKNPLGFILGLLRILNQNDIQLVHVHQNYSSWLAVLLARFRGKKVVVHGHQYFSKESLLVRVYNGFARLFIELADYKIACTDESNTWLWDGKADLVLPYSMNLAQFEYNLNDRYKIRKDSRTDDSKIVIGHIGRFSKQKNQKFLLEIFSFLSDEKYELWIIGAGELEKEIKSYAKELRLQNIKWFPPVSDVEKFYSAFDIFLLPSLWEGLGIVGIESQCSGLPTIISDVLPMDLNQSDLVHRLSLDCNPKHWSEYISNIELPNNRKEYLGVLEATKYNIETGVNELFDVYHDLA